MRKHHLRDKPMTKHMTFPIQPNMLITADGIPFQMLGFDCSLTAKAQLCAASLVCVCVSASVSECVCVRMAPERVFSPLCDAVVSWKPPPAQNGAILSSSVLEIKFKPLKCTLI